MNTTPTSHKLISAAILCSTVLSACTAPVSREPIKKIPVAWSTGFTMPELLETPIVHLEAHRDLEKLLTAPWYSGITVSQTAVEETTFSSCNDYFNNAKPSTRTIKDDEMDAYLELTMMCEATRILINAREAKVSYLPYHTLNKEAPRLWPKEVALQISTEEARRAASNQNLITWNDVTPITRYEKKSETKSTYFHQGGSQEVEIVGTGDTNNDDVEDLIITVRDHTDEGSYFNIRLFVLSKDRQGGWKLISRR